MLARESVFGQDVMASGELARAFATDLDLLEE